MRKILTLSIVLTSGALFGQEVIATQGETFTNGSGSVSYTIGETVIHTGTNGPEDITQGFHQTNWNFLGVEDHMPELIVKVYPNPVQHELKVETADYNGVLYSMLDGAGRIVRSGELNSAETAIETSNLAPGKYILSLSDQNQTLKTFNLIKNN